MRATEGLRVGFKEWVDGWAEKWVYGWPVSEVWADRWVEGEGKGGVKGLSSRAGVRRGGVKV